MVNMHSIYRKWGGANRCDKMASHPMLVNSQFSSRPRVRTTTIFALGKFGPK